MGLPKRRPVESPAERVVRDRVERVRRSQPRWDATGEWFERCVDLARSVGADLEAVVDEHWERAAVMHYDGAMSIEEAEAAAFEHVRERFAKQGALL